jgi:hypothetical protein
MTAMMSHFFCLPSFCNDFDSQNTEALPRYPSSTVQTKFESDLATLSVGKGMVF